MSSRRITLFSGHYGSGKTNLALDYALRLKEEYPDVALADLDIVNPYFRSKDSEALLAQKGIRMIASPYAGSNVDTPALPAEAYALIDDKRIRAFFHNPLALTHRLGVDQLVAVGKQYAVHVEK